VSAPSPAEPRRAQRPRSRLTAQSGETGDEAYWDQRQAALGIETHGEALEPDEIVFCERLVAHYPATEASSIVEWRSSRRYSEDGALQPSNDFVWLNGGGDEWELKSPEAPDYAAIKRRIRDDRRKGKTRFMVDVGSSHLDPELLAALTRYKQLRSIEGLVVMSENGATLTAI